MNDLSDQLRRLAHLMDTATSDEMAEVDDTAAFVAHVDQEAAFMRAAADRIDQLEAARPRWRKADPNDPSTWPEDGSLVLILACHVDVRRARVHVRPPLMDFHFADDDGFTWPSAKRSLHWMPWSEIGNPS